MFLQMRLYTWCSLQPKPHAKGNGCTSAPAAVLSANDGSGIVCQRSQIQLETSE